ncbi:MAG TPA: cupin domain-containing protein [Arachnia sp.]|nr:cupin domain-containing protein [Arachnia sp.]
MVRITNWRDLEGRQFNAVTTVWSDLISDDGFKANAGIGSYGAIPEGKTPEELAHADRDVELYYVIKGSGSLYVGGEGTRSIAEGDAFALPPLAHFIWSDSPDEPVLVYYVALVGSGAAYATE